MFNTVPQLYYFEDHSNLTSIPDVIKDRGITSVFRNIRKAVFLIYLLFFSLITEAQVTCIGSGTWSTATWSPAAPIAGQNVIVNPGCTLTIDVSTPMLFNLTINGNVIVTSSAASSLNMNGDLIINSTGSLENNGGIGFYGGGKLFNLNGNATYIHNPFSNLATDELIFSNSNETFASTSNLTISKWNDPSIALGEPSRVQSSVFGNVTLNAIINGQDWIQKGYFAIPNASNNRILGKLTISEGRIVMDEGAGNTSTLMLGDVEVNGNGAIVFQQGNPRMLTLTTGNFVVNSSVMAPPSIIQDGSFGVLTWNINGSLSINSNFYGLSGTAFEVGGDARINITGNLSVTGGNCILIRKADAPCRLTVAGTTTLNDPTGTVSFIEGATGNLNFTTGDLYILSGAANYLMGVPGASNCSKGIGNFTINNDCLINGSSNTYVAWSDSNVNKVRFVVGRDFNMNHIAASFVGSNISGAFTFRAGRNVSIYGGRFIGQQNTTNVAVDSFYVGADFYFNTPVTNNYVKINRGQGNTVFNCVGNFNMLGSGLNYGDGFIGVDSNMAAIDLRIGGNLVQNGGQFTGVLSGSGNLTMTVTGTLDVNQGIFHAFHNINYSNPGGVTFTVGNVDFDGGDFSVYHACNNASSTANVTIQGYCKVNFTAIADRFSFIGLTRVGTDESNILLSLSVLGAFTIQGVNGKFISSLSGASSLETISLASLTISGGINSFNSELTSPFANGHTVSILISGNLTVQGGSTCLSAKTQSISLTVNGNVTISSGELIFKSGDITGGGTFTVKGGYTQSGGNFYLHKAVSDTLNSGASISMTVNSDNDAVGDFIQTAGTYWFDYCSGTPPSYSMSLLIRSPNVQLGAAGRITQSNPSNYNAYGQLTYTRSAGTINLDRNSAHRITNIKQTIVTGCTLDMITGDLQLSSNPSLPPIPDLLSVQGVLNMRTNKLHSDAVNMYSGVLVTGRVRTAHTSGLYNGTTNAAFSTTLADSLDYYLSSASFVEYTGVDNQIVTGWGVGRARKVDHKYGNLEINFTGTPNTEFVYPTNLPNDSSVIIRGSLLLTSGEFNLDDDHVSSNGGGRMITLESSSLAMTRTAGYLRSEVENGSGRLKWNVATSIVAKTVHFGYSSTDYIPLTYTNTAGSSGYVYFATYHTPANNQPFPPTVNHIRNSAGLDNSSNTVDRFWYISTPGFSNVTATIDFKATASEIIGLSSLKAQRWVANANGWTLPLPGTQTSTAQGTTVVSPGVVNQWWTLSGNNNPLPVELLSFHGNCENNHIRLMWSTASETNNDHFTMERSIDAVDFVAIGEIQGSGTRTYQSDYSFNDALTGFHSDIAYYRLSQTDFDGTTKKFDPIAIMTCDNKSLLSFDVLDALSEKTLIHLNIPAAGIYRLNIYSVGGQLIRSDENYYDAGSYQAYIPSLPMASALYIATLSGNGEQVSRKWLGKSE